MTDRLCVPGPSVNVRLVTNCWFWKGLKFGLPMGAFHEDKVTVSIQLAGPFT